MHEFRNTVVFLVGASVLALSVSHGALEGRAAAKDAKEPVRIGLVSTLFRDVPPAVVRIVTQPFAALMHSQTGMTGVLQQSADAQTLGDELASNKVQLGVFHGVEFAWARQKHPHLRPLMIAINEQRYLTALLVVQARSDATRFADLQGKSLAVPSPSKEHGRLFLSKLCKNHGCEPEAFFASIAKAPTPEEALDSVFENQATAALVDGVAFNCYKSNNPGRHARLRVLETSELFPAGVVAYDPRHLDPKLVERFRQGMLNANNVAQGRQLMFLWRLTAFEPVPPDYEKVLQEIAEAYPPPPSAN
jgi:ABC-type phosphate/phosphonate transport system substrate-binding protein